MRLFERNYSSRSPISARTLLSIFLLSSSAQTARLAKRDEINYFVNPPAAGPAADFDANVNFNVGSVIDLGWVTDYDSVSLQLCQQNNDLTASCYPLFREQRNVGSVQWTVGLGSSGFLLSSSQIFYFQVFDGPLDAEGTFTCHYFNIVDRGSTTTQSVVTATVNPSAVAAAAAAAASSSGSVSSVAPILQTLTMTPDLTIQAAIQSEAPSTTSSSLPRTSATTTDTPSPSGSQTSNPPPDGGLSRSAKVGIGVGVGVGVLCLALGVLIGFCLWRRGKRRAAQTEQSGEHHEALTSHSSPNSGYPPGVFSSDPKYAPVTQFVPHGELPAEERPAEMGDVRWSTQELPGSEGYSGYEGREGR